MKRREILLNYERNKLLILYEFQNNNHYLNVLIIKHTRNSCFIYQAKCFERIDVMSTFMRRRNEFTKIRIALKEIFLKNRKKHLIKKIINLLRDKSFEEIETFESLFLLQRVNVLLSTFIVKNQIFLTLRKINIELKNLERNIAKIIFILFIYVIVTKTKNIQSVEFTIIIITTYNNIN